MDVFSRYVVGWMIANTENAALASEFIEVTCQRQALDRNELTIHAALRVGRALVLATAYAAHPERFVRGKPTPPPLPEAVWINKPKETDAIDSEPHESEIVIVPISDLTSGDGMPGMNEIPLLATCIKQQTLDEAAETKARA